MIDITLKKVDHLNRIVIPTNWLKDFQNQRLMMYSVSEKKQLVIIPEEIYKSLDLKPLILVIPAITEKGILTIKKEFREFIGINENDFLRLVYNKKLKIIVINHVKIQKIEDEFAKEFASFFSDPVVKKNIELIKKLEKQQSRKKSEKNE